MKPTNSYWESVSRWIQGLFWIWTLEAREYDRDVGEPPVAVHGWRYVRGRREGDTVLAVDTFISYKARWTPLKFFPVYVLDYGAAAILLGLGVQPISRWAGQRIKHAPWRWLAWVLNKLEKGHTDSAGGLLWETQPCPAKVRLVVVVSWVLLITVWWLG